MRKIIPVLTLFLAGCGAASQNLPGIVSPPVVHADGFTNASLSGGYALSAVTLDNQGYTIEQLTFDGTGGVTGHFTTQASILCMGAITGSYSINADGSGSMMFNIPSVDGCGATSQSFHFVLGANGATFFFEVYSGVAINSGQAIKQ